jgi:hypothetical protein
MKNKLDLLGVQEVIWDWVGTEPAASINFSMESEMRILI